MKTLLATLLTAVSLQAMDLSLAIDNPPESGSIDVLLFNSPATFGDLSDPAARFRVRATGQPLIALRDVPEGDFALLVHHDENGNGEMDKNFIGIPREPIGFANSYRPKGPPSYSRALVSLDETLQQPVAVELRRPLGKRGRFGVGLGAIIRSSPYRGTSGARVVPIPALTYSGERLQIFGPQLRFLLGGSDKTKVAFAANYRPKAYEEDDSHAFRGLGDRDATMMAGLELRRDLPAGLNLSLGYRHDVLDRIGGGEALAALDKPFQLGGLRLTPKAGLRWTAAELVNHDYGTSSYSPGATLHFETGLNLLAELNENWWISASVAAEFLGNKVTDSPIVEDSVLMKGFFSISYLF